MKPSRVTISDAGALEGFLHFDGLIVDPAVVSDCDVVEVPVPEIWQRRGGCPRPLPESHLQYIGRG